MPGHLPAKKVGGGRVADPLALSLSFSICANYFGPYLNLMSYLCEYDIKLLQGSHSLWKSGKVKEKLFVKKVMENKKNIKSHEKGKIVP